MRQSQVHLILLFEHEICVDGLVGKPHLGKIF